jgi:hypothetical protein
MLPTRRFGARWTIALSTFEPSNVGAFVDARGEVVVENRSLVLLQRA